MADVFFARAAQQQRIPLLVIAHRANEVTQVEGTKQSSIQAHSRDDRQSVKNTGVRQTELVRDLSTWRTFEWYPLRIALIGRFDRYTKGGIHKSCKLITESLRSRGHDVQTIDLGDLETPIRSKPDVAWIYPGDPLRPDFDFVNQQIARVRPVSTCVLVNFSYLYRADRSAWIKACLQEFNQDRSLAPVFAAVFTESVIDDSSFEEISDLIAMVPKTIDSEEVALLPSFADREGIVLGDATKLTKPEVIGEGIRPWLDAIGKRLPHVNLYAYKQYSGRSPHKQIINVPYMTDEFPEFLAGRRLFVNLNVHLTFEMVPCEAQPVGTPVLYRHMPHSLSEYIGPTGIRVRHPEEFAELAAWLYNEESAWEEFSGASRHNGMAISLQYQNAALEAALRAVKVRALRMRSR